MASTILMLGAFDTKGGEHAFLRERILGRGHRVLAADTGVLGSTDRFRVDIAAEEIARAGGAELSTLRERRDRGEAMKAMSAGAAVVARRLWGDGAFEGAIGMGGTGGTAVVTSALRALPLGVPKVCVSTAASGDTGPWVGTKDVVLIPSIVDVAGLNRISRVIFTRAAGAICGMVEESPRPSSEDRPVIVASMFGNTTECVDACRGELEARGWEVLVFHATGTGGRVLESLIDEGLVDACLDITTTEWADEICGGIFSAGPDRLSAAGRAGIPHLIAPGCVDMANFGPPDSVPARYREAGRRFYEWNPAVTLMRTGVEENRRMGEIFARKANEARGPVSFLVPLRGVSILDADGQPFCDREADRALFEAIEAGLGGAVGFEAVDANINEPRFAERAVRILLELIERATSRPGKKRTADEERDASGPAGGTT